MDEIYIDKDGVDNIQCGNRTKNNSPCRTISFVIQNRIHAKSTMIILLGKEYCNNDSQLIDVSNTKESRHIIITGKQPVLAFCSLSIISYKFNPELDIIFHNVTFEQGKLVLFNVKAIFSNVILLQNIITDDSVLDARKERKGKLALMFENCIIINSSSIIISTAETLSLAMENSIFSDGMVHVYVRKLWFKMKNVSNYKGKVQIHLETHEYSSTRSLVELQHINIGGNPSLNSDHNIEHTFHIAVSNAYISIDDSHFHDLNKHFLIENKDDRTPSTNFLVSISNSRFINNTGFGSGGALSISVSLNDKFLIASIHIDNCTFGTNNVLKGHNAPGRGGAISVENSHAQHAVDILIENCIFYDNFAQNSGGSLNIDGLTNITIKDTTFHYTRSAFPEYNLYAFVHGYMIISRVKFHAQITGVKSLIQYQSSDNLHARLLNFEVHCPPWHRVHSATSFESSSTSTGNRLLLKAFTTTCIACAASTYYPSNGKYKVAFNNLTQKVVVQELQPLISSVTDQDKVCIKCPTSAVCAGNNLVPIPNYWGYFTEERAVLKQCPVGYCCSNTEKSPCSEYHSCAGNRTGTLCGACLPGFSVSIISGQCISNGNCGSPWFWALAVFSACYYVAWYSFKDIFFQTIIRLLKGLCKVHSKMKRKVSLETLTTKTEKTPTRLCSKPHTSEKEAKEDKGYFGILAYFVQASALMKVKLDLDGIVEQESYMKNISKSLYQFLDINLAKLGDTFCPILGLSMTGKVIYDFLFLAGIYFCWFLFFSLLFLLQRIRFSSPKIKTLFTNLQAFLTTGIIEIIKYSYSSFAKLTFMTLTCVGLSDSYVWFYDGTVTCLSKFQIGMLFLGINYTIPFFLSLALGIKLLSRRAISSLTFILSCIFPLPFILLWLPKLMQNKNDQVKPLTVTKTSQLILTNLQGPYRNEVLFWESILILRRLVLSISSLIPDVITHLFADVILCSLYLIHHIITKPFVHSLSNRIETCSLWLLLLVSCINLMKAFISSYGSIPLDSTLTLIRTLLQLENGLVIIVLIMILVLEVKLRVKQKNK